MSQGSAAAFDSQRPDSDWFSGREDQLDEFVACARGVVRDGAAGIVIEGAPGFGKTTLLRHALAALPDFAVLGASCDPAETSTVLAAYSQVLRQTGGLPRASLQRPVPTGGTAVEAGAALLHHLEARHATTPAVVAVDDAQWIDKASAEAFGFVLRRLRTLHVVFVLCLRTSAQPPASHAAALGRTLLDRPRALRIRTGGLSTRDVEALARSTGLDSVGRVAAERIREQTEGYPQHVRAVLSELPPERLTDLNRPLPVPDSIHVEISIALRELPDGSRRLAEALAVLDEAAPLVAAGRIGSVDDPVAALEPLLAGELVRWWPEDPVTPVRIRTGTHRSAIYQAISPRRRHALHRAAVRHGTGGDVWLHRVAAADGTEPDLATELAGAAHESSSRGDTERAARLMLWAASLSTDRPGSERRLESAARYLLRARKDEQLAALLPRLQSCAPGPARDLMLGLAAYMRGRLAMAGPLLRAAAGSDEPGVVETPVELWLAAIYARQDRPEAEAEVARLLLSADVPDPGAASWAHVYQADAAGRTHGGAAAALAQLAQAPVGLSADAPLRWARGIWQVLAGKPAAAIEDLRTATDRSAEGIIGTLGVTAGAFLAYAHYSLGAWDAASTTADNAVRLARRRGRSWQVSPVHAIATCIAAGRGEWDRARQHLRDTEQSYALIGLESCRIYPAFAAAALAQAQADFPAMLRAINQVADAPRPTGDACYLEPWWRPLHLEALLGMQQLQAAAESLRRLELLSEDIAQLRLAVDWLAGWLAHLTGDERTAQARFDGALARLATADDPPMQRARLNEAYARLLLDQHNRRGAVACLREAQDSYVLLQAQPFLDRCADLLRACGLEPADSRNAPSLSALSHRELRVARLVGAGLTNKEAAKELFVSPKTVEYHLGNIFLKLGIGSRRELRALMRDRDVPGSP